MKDDRLSKTIFVGLGQTKIGLSPNRVEGCRKQILREMRNFSGGVKEALDRMGRMKNVHSCVGLRRLSAAVSC